MEEKPSFLTEWEDYFMAHAHLNSLRSKNFLKRRGACLVDGGNKIISNSYNGRPYVHDEEKKKEFPYESDGTQITAVENAFYFKTKLIEEGCKIYLTHFPTREEIAKIIANNVEEVVYSMDIYDQNEVEDLRKEFGKVLTIRKKVFTVDVKRLSSNKFSMTVESDTLNIDAFAEGLL